MSSEFFIDTVRYTWSEFSDIYSRSAGIDNMSYLKEYIVALYPPTNK